MGKVKYVSVRQKGEEGISGDYNEYEETKTYTIDFNSIILKEVIDYIILQYRKIITSHIHCN
ncbi:hypothetical protein QJR52_09420 [Clostridium baratii]|uniref:hypothetical protein n=1 Tax=Clostridium baratii TaxID=1561 RepID=UPI0022DF0E78|nr:hypothetical protein [Clostridium baratii]